MRYGAGILASCAGGGAVGALGGYLLHVRAEGHGWHRGTDAVAGLILGAVAGMLAGIVILA